MIRRKFITVAGIGLAGMSLSTMGRIVNGDARKAGILRMYIGSYTSKPDDGITVGKMQLSSGKITSQGLPVPCENPSFIALSPDAQFLYAVIETSDFPGSPGGGLSAYRIDPDSGNLEWINSQPSMGADPCHLCVSSNGKFVLVANYTGGNVSVLPLLTGGRLGKAVCVRQHEGHGPNASRQEKPHAHSINLSPDNRFAYVCDLGIDRIMVYAFNELSGLLTPAPVPFFQCAPGSGPRHFTFSPDGRRAFVINELDSTVTSFTFDTLKGRLTAIHTVSTLPGNFTAINTCADLHVDQKGRFLYASNRGHDSIATFRVDQETGRLTILGQQTVGGKTPRNFVIDPSGNFLLAANQDSNNITVLRIDQQTGLLSLTDFFLTTRKPVCIVLTPHH